MIEFKQVYKTYQINHRLIHALQDITLTIEQGEIFGVLGKSGAGKSTLLRCVNLLEKPSKGQIIVNHVDMVALSKEALKQQRRKIGMIFQHFNLLASRTAFENIALPLELVGKSRTEIKQTVSSLLELVHLQEHADHYPKQLSGGQKQRVAIARALATRPDVLLCDEATSALDTSSTLAILNLLKEINQKLAVTILLITHELDVIKQICDRAGVLDHGRLIECATVLDLFSRPQAAVTKQLVQKALHIELPQEIKKRLKSEPSADSSWIVRLMFYGHASEMPLITTLIKRFDITINLLQANIENVQDTTIGFTLCQLSGSATAIQQALEYVKASSITAEVLGYV